MAENPVAPEPQGTPDLLTLMPLTRRSQPAAERAPLPPEIEEQFNQLMQNVQVLSAHFMGESAPPPTESLKERTARRIKKFQRASGDERAAAPGSGEDGGLETPTENTTVPFPAAEEATDPLALNKHIAWPRRGDTGRGIPSASGIGRWRQHRRSVGLWLGAPVLGLTLLVAGYLIGQASRSPAGSVKRTRPGGHTAVDLFGQPELTEQALLIANEALHAEHLGDADGARKIYESALDKRVNLTGVNYRLALLAVQRNDRLEAEQRLERSTLDGENVAECCYVLARLAADKGDLDEAADQFQRATRARPLDGKYFFYYGELLRRQGKPQAAVSAFEQALDRPYPAENGDLFLFKLRLAKVEYGHDDAFNAELASHLKQPPVAGEWLLLAAAGELDHQAYAAAAEHLQQAVDRVPSPIYAALTHDYFFQTFVKQPEVAALLNHTSPLVISSAGPTVLDPGSWSPARADPGMWPTGQNSPQ